MTLRRLLGLALILLIATSCTIVPWAQPTPVFEVPSSPTPASGSLYTVVRGSIAEIVQARGQVVSVQEAVLSFRLRGYIKALNVAVGDRVRPGTVIAELEADDLQLELLGAQYGADKAALDLEEAKARRGRLETQLEAAQYAAARRKTIRDRAWKDYQGVAHLGDKAWAELNTLESAEVELHNAQAEEQKAQADLALNTIETRSLERELAYRRALAERKQARLDDTKLAASFNGVVVALDVIEGEEVKPYQVIGAIADPSRLQAEIRVLEADLDRVAVGKPVALVLDAYPGVKHLGRVQRIGGESSLYQGKKTYKAIVTFDSPAAVPATVRMGVDATIASRVKADVLVAPLRAVASDGAQRYVDVISDGLATRTPISIGITGEGMAEVVSGLREGQVIRIP